MNKKYKYLIIILLIVSSLIAFGRIIGNDFVNFDDNYYITENNHIKSGISAESIKWAFTTTYYSYWHPLTWLSYMLDWSLFGANASGHHLVSLLWHIGSAILLFLFLSKTTGSLWPSALAAALFALHPLRVESVAWASERKDVLSMFFGLASLYAYAYYVESLKGSKYFLCLILFALSLMAKPMLVTLPFVMLLLDYWPLGRWQKVLYPQNTPDVVSNTASAKKKKHHKQNDQIVKKLSLPVQSRSQLISNLLWEKVPFIVLAMLLSITLIWQQQATGGMAPLEQIPFSERIINSIISYASYLGKTFWPVDLTFFYPYVYFPIWQVLGASLLLLGISAVVIYLARRTPLLAVGWLWYLGTLFPVIGLLQAGKQSMADRYTYFPSIGITIMLVWGIVYLLPKEKLHRIIIIPTAFILATLTFLTWQQCGYWKNSIILFNHALQTTKDNYEALVNLGQALAAEGKHEEAIAHYLAAINISPHIAPPHYIALPHYLLAVSLQKLGKVDAAITHYREALRINPGHSDAHINLGFMLVAEGKLEEAIIHYREAIKINPNTSIVHYNLGMVLKDQGKIEEALNEFRETARIRPSFADAHNNIGIILEMYYKKYDEAIYHYRQALQIEPNNFGIHFNLGVALGKKGNLEEAIEHFRQTIYLKPDYEAAHRALKLALEMNRQRR